MDDFSKVCVVFPHRPFFYVLLLAAVLSSCTGSAASVDTGLKIVATAGETVLLPCITTASNDVPPVEWTKQGTHSSSVIAFLYRDGCETFEMKDPVFRYRTNLIMHELHHGNLSMLMSNVQPNDSGKYQCVIPNKKKQVITTLELFVGAVSEPRLSVVPGVGGGLTLQCEARCWFPEPLITLFDNQGIELSAEPQRRLKNTPGCLTVIRRVTLQAATNRVTCRVHQPEINQTRDAEIYIPEECLRSCTVIIAITAAITTIVVVCICAAVAFLVKKHYFCAGQQKCRPVNEDKDVTGLTTKGNDHKSKPDQVQQPRQSANEPRSSPGTSRRYIPPPPKSPYNSNTPKPTSSNNIDRPKSGCLPQTNDSEPVVSGQNPAYMKKNRNSGSSAVSASEGAAPSIPPPDSKEKPPSRSMSVSERQPRGGVVRSPRRNTFSVPTNNPYSVLSEDSEDAKPLI